MVTLWKRAATTVRPRSRGGAPLLPCVLLFGLTATAVYRWGGDNWVPVSPHPSYTATAYVVPRVPGGPPDVATPTATRAEDRIPVRYADADPQRAAKIAYAWAERYIHDCTAEWNRRMEEACSKAREMLAKSRQAHARSVARLDAFRRQLVLAAEAAAKARSTVEPPRPLPPRLVDNPQWLDLDHQLTELQWWHEQLLVDRTPLHPTVRDFAGRIAGFKEQLAAIPRQIPDTQAGEANAKPPSAPPPMPEALVTTTDQETLAELTAAVERTRQACEEAESADAQAIAVRQTVPQFTIDRAKVVEDSSAPDYGWRRLMGTAVMAGLLMAIGIASLWAGAKIEPAVGTIEEVRHDVGAPVVAIIPADNPLPDPAATGRGQVRSRRALIAAGLVLIIASPAIAVWGVVGI